MVSALPASKTNAARCWVLFALTWPSKGSPKTRSKAAGGWDRVLHHIALLTSKFPGPDQSDLLHKTFMSLGRKKLANLRLPTPQEQSKTEHEPDFNSIWIPNPPAPLRISTL